MPELPEVETVRRGLEEMLVNRPKIREVILRRADVRFPIPKTLPQRLKGQVIIGVRRRAKYLLIETESAILLSHLGMTGSWRLFVAGEDDKHDHCYILLEDGRQLAFRDPRRFGMLDLLEPGGEDQHLRLKDLGVEPLDKAKFTPEFLYRLSRRRRVALKVFIMDQKVVVGVGNIYASEALFRAGLRPQKLTARLTLENCERLVESIRSILSESIAAGGSSISDYRQASGAEGAFQERHVVYDRAGEPCRVCGAPIRTKVIGGRSTFWCGKCQHG